MKFKTSDQLEKLLFTLTVNAWSDKSDLHVIYVKEFCGLLYRRPFVDQSVSYQWKVHCQNLFSIIYWGKSNRSLLNDCSSILIGICIFADKYYLLDHMLTFQWLLIPMVTTKWD